MKILSLIKDGHGRLHAEHCASPDLKRRAIAAETGSAVLIWCGLAAPGQRSAEVISELRAILDASPQGAEGLAAGARLVIRRAYWLTVMRPRLFAAMSRVRRLLRRAFGTPAHKASSGLRSQPMP
ncbi:hypothetical protein [Pelagibacterium halotolerans]|uniref:hypothetical protein n=1 Tax=Pelagibacterium halotolerans TaxID=531813 RepID=UPI00384E181A